MFFSFIFPLIFHVFSCFFDTDFGIIFYLHFWWKKVTKMTPKIDKKNVFFPKKGANLNIQVRTRSGFFFTFFWTFIFWLFGSLLGPFGPRLGPLSHILAPRGGHFGAPGTILETIFDDFLWFFNRWFWDRFFMIF